MFEKGQKVLYIPDNVNTVILEVLENYVEILVNGDFKTVSLSDISTISTTIDDRFTLEKLKQDVYLSCIRNPISDILYSFNTGKLFPEPHQYKPLIKFINSDNNRVLIADEVGLGKTIEAGMIFKEIDNREDLRISLIVVPSSLTIKWQEEFSIRFDEYFEIKKTNQFLQFIEEFDVYNTSKSFKEKIIISYHTLRDERVVEKLKESFFEVDFLIMDEAHTMRNDDTSTFDSGRIITSISDHIIFLTATPVQNKIKDLFNILHLLDNDYFKDFEYFEKIIAPNSVIHRVIALVRNNKSLSEVKQYIKDSYDDSFPIILLDEFSYILDLKELTNENRVEIIDNLIKSDHLSFIINRTKKKDVGRLIPRNAKSVIVNLTVEEQNYYDAVITLVKFLNPDTPQGFITIMPERMASSSMLASLENFKEVKESGKLFIKGIDDLEEAYEDLDIRSEAQEYLNDIIRKGDLIGDKDSKFIKFLEIVNDLHSRNIKQIIVFSFFKYTLNYLEKKLIDLGFTVGKIHGDFTVEERYSKIKDFKHGDFDILLTSEVGSEGLDMQFANVVLNYDLPWNPMRVEQRIGRIDRIGQKFDKLHIFNLCISGSIEDRIYNRLYEKLNIFESSIGELEPILGNLEKDLNIAELIKLSQSEIDEKLHLKELSLKRQELEINTQNTEVEKLINEDYNIKEKKEAITNFSKINILQSQTKSIVIDFLNKNNISFLELKSGELKFSSENKKRLIQTIKPNLSDKRKYPNIYKDERDILHKIHKLKDLRISFETNNNDDFNTLYIYIDNPIIGLITKNIKIVPSTVTVKHTSLKGGYAVIFRVDFNQRKSKSYIRTISLDNNYNLINNEDYFKFISNCSHSPFQKSIDVSKVKNKTIPFIASYIDDYKLNEERDLTRLIDVKINSVNSYFDKQVRRAKRMEQKVSQEGIKRMKIAEIEGIEQKRTIKIEELESQKVVNSSFEILGYIELT